MIKRAAFLLGLVLSDTAMADETISVRAGEHEGFTRLVFQMSALAEWQLSSETGGFVLETDLDRIAVNASDAFRRITSGRVSAIEAQGGSGIVRIAAACVCDAQAVMLNDGRLVVDIGPTDFEGILANAVQVQGVIQDGPGPEVTVTPNASPSTSASRGALSPLIPALDVPLPQNMGRIMPPATPSLPDDPREAEDKGVSVDAEVANHGAMATDGSSPSDDQLAEGVPGTGGTTSNVVATMRTPVQSATAPQAKLPVFSVPMQRPDAGFLFPEQAPSEDVTRGTELAQDLVVREIARAAAQGLLRPNDDLAQMPAGPTDDQPSPQRLDVDELASILDALPSVRAETSVDRGLARDRVVETLTDDGNRCIPSARLDLANWADSDALGDQLAEYRSALVGEFDAPDRRAVIGLAKRYVYLSFGAEARSLLEAFQITGPDADRLRVMAEVMDYGFANNMGPFRDQLSCGTAAAFWAAMVRKVLEQGQNIDRPAVMRNFSALPLHLRRHLGPILALRFLEIGDRDTAFAIRDAISRAPGDHGEGFDLLAAYIDADLGDTDAAERRFDAIAALDGSLAPRALIERVDLALAQGTNLPEGTIDAVAALAFEHRGTETGAQLARSYVLANILSGAFDEALSSLLRIETGDASERDIFPELWSQLALGMAREPEDAKFLSTYYRHRDTLRGRAVSSPARQQLAQRLLELGFTGDTLAEMSVLGESRNAAQRILTARALFLQGAFNEALAQLDGMEAREALQLRAELAEIQGRFGRAIDLYTDLGDQTGKGRAAWRSGDWGTVAEVDAQARGAAARMMQNPVVEFDPDQGTIARNEASLANSQNARAVIEQLLSE